MTAYFTPEVVFDWRAALRKFSHYRMPRIAAAALAGVLLTACSVQDLTQRAEAAPKASNIRGSASYAYTTPVTPLTHKPVDRPVAAKRPAQLVGFNASPYICSASGFGQKARCLQRS